MSLYVITAAFMLFFILRLAYIAYRTTGPRNRRYLSHFNQTWSDRAAWAMVTASRWTFLLAIGMALGRCLTRG